MQMRQASKVKQSAKDQWNELYAKMKKTGVGTIPMDCAMDNAVDSANIENRFEYGSEEFYDCALNSIACGDAVNYTGLSAIHSNSGKDYSCKQVIAQFERCGFLI